MLQLDETVTGILGQWDIYTTILFGSLVTFFVYRVISFRDPDAHPMLLARQAQASPVRNDGESSVFRSHSAPHGMPLNSGLNVKDPGDSKWARGRDGDIRDIWRKVASGRLDQEGKETGEKGKLFTVMGSEKVTEHETGTFLPTPPLVCADLNSRYTTSDQPHRATYQRKRRKECRDIPPKFSRVSGSIICLRFLRFDCHTCSIRPTH